MREHGELEALVVESLRAKGGATVAEVRSRLGPSVAYTTVMTVLGRLCTKGVASREKVGRSYLYSLVEVEPKGWVKRLLGRFGGPSRLLIHHLIEESDDLTESDLEEIEKMIQERRRR